MNSYFSVNQANEILPTVIKKFEYAKKMKVEVASYDLKLQQDEVKVSTSLEFNEIN